MERRVEPRARVDLMVNKYIDGYPYLCEAVNISWTGILVRRVIEPAGVKENYPIEVGLPGFEDPIWIWSRPIWSASRYEALKFVSLDARDARTLAKFVAALAA